MDLTPKKKRELSLWVIVTVSVCALIFLAVQNLGTVAAALGWVFGLIRPLVLGFAMAVILNVPMGFIERKLLQNCGSSKLVKLCRPAAFILSLLFILGVITGVVSLVIPELVNAFAIIAQGISDTIGTVSAMSVEELEQLPFGKTLLGIDWDAMLLSLQNWLKDQGGSIVNTAFGTIGSLVGGVFDFFMALVFAIYILFSKDTLKSQGARLLHAWLPERAAEWLIHAFSVANVSFRNFISGQSLEAVILGVLCLVGMLILDLPYAPMVGALVGITALIPVVGAFIGAAVGAFMILTVSPVKALVFVVFLVLLQQIEGNLIYPKVMSSRVSLPGMWILAAVVVGSGIAGALGMLLGVPIASTAYVLIAEATAERESQRRAQPPQKNDLQPAASPVRADTPPKTQPDMKNQQK